MPKKIRQKKFFLSFILEIITSKLTKEVLQLHTHTLLPLPVSFTACWHFSFHAAAKIKCRGLELFEMNQHFWATTGGRNRSSARLGGNLSRMEGRSRPENERLWNSNDCTNKRNEEKGWIGTKTGMSRQTSEFRGFEFGFIKARKRWRRANTWDSTNGRSKITATRYNI